MALEKLKKFGLLECGDKQTKTYKNIQKHNMLVFKGLRNTNF